MKYEFTFKDEPVIGLSPVHFLTVNADITKGSEEGKITKTKFRNNYISHAADNSVATVFILFVEVASYLKIYKRI